jgi:ATP-dependent protease ClpP protease subunit
MEVKMTTANPTISEELAFLRTHTGQDEATILLRAVDRGLDLMYREAVEQGFIEETLSRQNAVTVLGEERVRELEYAKQALAQDIINGLGL